MALPNTLSRDTDDDVRRYAAEAGVELRTARYSIELLPQAVGRLSGRFVLDSTEGPYICTRMSRSSLSETSRVRLTVSGAPLTIGADVLASPQVFGVAPTIDALEPLAGLPCPTLMHAGAELIVESTMVASQAFWYLHGYHVDRSALRALQAAGLRLDLEPCFLELPLAGAQNPRVDRYFGSEVRVRQSALLIGDPNFPVVAEARLNLGAWRFTPRPVRNLLVLGSQSGRGPAGDVDVLVPNASPCTLQVLVDPATPLQTATIVLAAIREKKQ